jgi:hypothetical protein
MVEVTDDSYTNNSSCIYNCDRVEKCIGDCDGHCR